MLDIFARPVRFFFFAGKGGVGKTSLACAAAVGLADRRRGTLLECTDPASYLDAVPYEPTPGQAQVVCR